MKLQKITQKRWFWPLVCAVSVVFGWWYLSIVTCAPLGGDDELINLQNYYYITHTSFGQSVLDYLGDLWEQFSLQNGRFRPFSSPPVRGLTSWFLGDLVGYRLYILAWTYADIVLTAWLVGKAFRNEIVARQFIFRMREFEQMEMQFFVRPGEEMRWWAEWRDTRMKWHRALGFGADNYRFHDHDKLAHYANAATDIEYNFPFGFKEVEGIHSRTDFDLSNHQKFSGKKIQYFDSETGESYVPYVVETSIGVDRMFLQVMSAAYTEEKLENGEERVVLRIPAALAPTKVAVLPLVKKDGMPEVAQRIVDLLKYDFNVVYDEKDSVGKRYRRQDAIGTPLCVTVDGQTLEDNTVTVRHRDTMQQERVAIDALFGLVDAECSLRSLLKKLNV